MLHAIVLGYLYIYPRDYVSLENACSSAAAAHQRRQYTAYKVFAGYTQKILYILTEFQISERLHRGPEFSHNYLIDYTIGFIIITVFLLKIRPF